MPLISHRGAAHLALANGFDAIMAGDSCRPSYVEVDINCTSDGHLIIYHGSLTRFLQGKRTKESYSQLKKSLPHLMTLDEFVKKPIKSAYILDIKINDLDSLDKIAESLKRMDRDDFAFTSPHEHALVNLHKSFPSSPIFQSQPYHHGPVTALEIARKHNFTGVALNKWWMTPLVYRLCKAHGKLIDCYTVDSKLGMRIIHRFFPDVYITTNRPDLYRELYPED
jgi:glycerophosphoryl diester phosphodiesterase